MTGIGLKLINNITKRQEMSLKKWLKILYRNWHLQIHYWAKTWEAKDTIFRIYRDVRFSKDKSPYKVAMGANMAPGGRKSVLAGHYFHIEPGNSFLAGGSYCPPSEQLKNIRSEIYYNSQEFKEIINYGDFKNLFGEITGDKLKRSPLGFPKDFEDVELLKFKDYTIFHKIDDETIQKPDFLAISLGIFVKDESLYWFCNRAIG